MKVKARNRYESIPKRSFRNAIVRLLEDEYKLVGSHKVINMISDDIISLHKKFYPDIDKMGFGTIAWRTTKAGCSKPSYGTKAEDYEVQTVMLPLVRDEDIEYRIKSWYSGNSSSPKDCHEQSTKREVELMARLVKSAYKQGGLLTGAELSVLMNRSLTLIGKYIRIYHRNHKDILPTKGMILDQGSKPTHKGAILNLYEQGYPEVDIARMTNHTIESTSRYLKNYKKIKMLIEKNFNLIEIVRTTGMGRSTIIQYRDLVYLYHPELNKENQKKEGG